MTEEQYLAMVQRKLGENIEKIDHTLKEQDVTIGEMNDYFWENYTEFDEYGYEQFDNTENLKRKVNEKATLIKERHVFELMQDSPYFARIDFIFEGEEEPEVIYIGLANLADSAADIPIVYDWRAPISSLFYDFESGKAFYQAPAGQVDGELVKKMQIKIKKGKIVYALESNVNIDDEILCRELSGHADTKLKSIVNTIQKEQNAIVRDASHRILVVQGCAGSGKTSIALHRIAYLLYHNRQKLDASSVLILSPNGVFADYISRILPELGEENISEMALDDFAYHELKDIAEAEDRYDEIEKKLCPVGEEAIMSPRTVDADYKQTKEFMEEMEGFIISMEYEFLVIRDFHYKYMELSEDKISELFYEKFADTPFFSRMEMIAEYIMDEAETLRGIELPEEERFEVIARCNRMYDTTDLLQVYNRFLTETGREALDVSGGMIRYEDVYPLLYFKYSLWKMKPRKKVKHLVIDEMQDYSYLQYVILGKLFKCPMTILGDKAQTMSEKEQDVTKFLPKIFGKDVTVMTLDKSYRSTTEITEYAAKLIGQNTTNCIDRHGDIPIVDHFASQELMLEKIAKDLLDDSEAETKAVLCRNRQEASMVAECLQKICTGEKVTLLDKNSMKFSSGIIVTTFYLSKGLEFDAVFVPFVNKYFTPLYHQALYIEATRALHTLRLYETD